jgi:Uncharacterised MFS-type transporter YbfB
VPPTGLVIATGVVGLAVAMGIGRFAFTPLMPLMIRDGSPTPLLARMTVAFAIGQIAGPLLVRALGPESMAGRDALFWANVLASVLLATTAVWLWRKRSL